MFRLFMDWFLISNCPTEDTLTSDFTLYMYLRDVELDFE